MTKEKNNNISFDDIVQSREELSSVVTQRNSEYLYNRIPIDDVVPFGWELDKELQTSKKIRKKKEMWKRFEDRLWLMFNSFEFEALNNDYEPEVLLSTRQNIIKRFDVIAKSDEFVFFVECRSNSSKGARSDTWQTINDLSDSKKYLNKLVREHYDNDYIEPVMVLALENISVSEQEMDLARRKSVKIWDISTISYLEKLAGLTKRIGEVARYQLYAMMFRDRKHRESVKIPAIKCSAGKVIYYSFMATPEQLLRIAYVHRRGSNIQDTNKVVLTYQRMIEPGKLKLIYDYIEKQSFPFPNSVIINFDDKVVFSEAADRKDINNGMLTLPRSYGSAWIIDGQHRLFGYALSERRKKDLIPVIAFERLSDSEQARLFVDINLNQKSVNPNLMWDLKEDIYENTEDKKQKRDLIISKIGKRLATLQSSPLYHEVSLPSYPELADDAPITLNAICATIKSSGILSSDYYAVDSLGVDDAVDTVVSGLQENFRFFATKLDFDWKLGKQGFTKSANGISALIWLFRQTLHYLNTIENPNFYRSKSKRKELAELINNLYQPIVQQFTDYKGLADKLRMKRGASGQKESANDLCIYIKSETPEFRTLLKSPEITEDTKFIDDNDFDLAIKSTELSLRAFTKQRLVARVGTTWYRQNLPSDVKDSINNLVENEIKKYPYKEIDSNEKRFDFIQLGELKKTILVSWSVFNDVFGTKERFTSQMDEFINLRNALRGHPREIDAAQRNSGRGAMIWLNKCIKSKSDTAAVDNNIEEADTEDAEDSTDN